MRKLKFLKTLLVVATLLVGGSNAWADTEYSQAWLNDCSTTTGWSYRGNAASSISITTNNALVANDSYLNFKTDNGKDRENYYSLSSASSFFATTTDYMFEFDLAIYGSNAANHLAHLKLFAGKTVVFSIDCTSYDTFQLNAGTAITANNITVTNNNSSTRDNIGAATVWHHYTVVSNATDGTTLKVEKWNNGNKESVIAQTQIASGLMNLSELNIIGGSYQQWSLDNVKLSINVEPYKTRASAATTVYASIKDNIMNTEVKSSLDDAYTTLVAFSDDAAIIADIPGYVAATVAMETANANAQASIDKFAILNDLISNAAGINGYVAPDGAGSVFTANANVDADALIASVRTAIITAGTANENTDMTALIANSSFELGNTLGWTTVASNDTGARGNANPYTTSGIDGNWQFNSWSQGTPITQNIGTLPAGQYKLTALVASDGGTIYLTMNDSHNAGVLTTASGGGTYVENEYIFTLGSSTEVTIGAVGGDGAGNFVAAGHWWYKADKFTLTYIGEDPLEQAKSALNDEIDAATTVKDNYTAKVGTAPFKYPIATYNTLVSELNEAATVAASNSTTPTDYTTAKDELEAAKNEMVNSTIIQPDGTKFYRLYSAGSSLNVNLLQGKNLSVTLSSVPAAVKIVPVSNGYNIRDVYNNNLMHMQNNGGVWGAGETGQTMRGERFTVALQDNGTIKITSAYVGLVLSAASQSEGSYVGRNGSFDTWEVSDPVDITDVTLGVNATAGWGTFIAPYDNLTPSTVKAYTVSHTNNNVVYFEENTTGVLSANTPYILSTDENSNVSVAFKGIANNDEDTYSVNGLVGLLTAGAVPANSYVLQYQPEEDGTSFYKVTSDMAGTANRCYLDLASVPTSAPAGARADVSFNLYGDASGISIVSVNEANSNQAYSISGQRVNKPSKGLYIVNGKKFIVK